MSTGSTVPLIPTNGIAKGFFYSKQTLFKQEKILRPMFRPRNLTDRWNYCDKFPTKQSFYHKICASPLICQAMSCWSTV